MMNFICSVWAWAESQGTNKDNSWERIKSRLSRRVKSHLEKPGNVGELFLTPSTDQYTVRRGSLAARRKQLIVKATYQKVRWHWLTCWRHKFIVILTTGNLFFYSWCSSDITGDSPAMTQRCLPSCDRDSRDTLSFTFSETRSIMGNMTQSSLLWMCNGAELHPELLVYCYRSEVCWSVTKEMLDMVPKRHTAN